MNAALPNPAGVISMERRCESLHILIAEDEPDLRNLLRLQLEREGYSVTAAADGAEALELLTARSYDLAIFDIMMPRLDGLSLLRKLRERSSLPVILLTARGEELDKILGLGLGADDYLVKPFGMGELLARVGALLRRTREYAFLRPGESGKLKSRDLCLDKDACCLYKSDRPIALNAKEFLLLRHLMENAGRVFTKKQLYRAVWDEETYYDDNTIMVHISHLRSKIETDPKNPEYIRTVRGIGYNFRQARAEAAYEIDHCRPVLPKLYSDVRPLPHPCRRRPRAS